MALRLFSRRQDNGSGAPGSPSAPQARPARAPTAAPDHYEPADPHHLDEDPLHRLLQLERYGIISADPNRWSGHPEAAAITERAIEAIDALFALVPEGFTTLPQTLNDYAGSAEEDVPTEPFLLARYTVTNAQYQKFVDGGGYEDLDLWQQDVWPHLIDFKDQTGYAAPRYWRNGRHDRRLADHPVVGVCYYEALSYARWAGCRLPTEAEWQMAASWRIRSAAHVFRRYPWGDALDKRRCNIWASGIGRTVPVDAFEDGMAPNGVLQLVGNVWEWTASDFAVTDDEGNVVIGDMLMKSIRGGAFDTYFASQATSGFRTGLASLLRSHNVGFRCAMDILD